jgi:ABC-type transport system involved in multi-copper enzyme maturation permease subunit
MSSMVYFAFTAEMRFGPGGNAANLQQLQTFAPALGGFYVWFQFAVMCFVASTLTAPTICDERRKGSLSTLIATPLTPTQIILGKLSGRLTQLVVLLLAGVPLLLAIRIFGGVSASFVLSATTITLCTALMHASIALAASARVRLPSIAAGTGVVSGIGFALLPMFVALFLNAAGLRRVDQTVLGISPYFALGVETARSLGEAPPVFWVQTWLISCGYTLTVAAFFLLLAIYRFHRLAALAGESGFSPEPRRQKKARRATASGDAIPRPASDEIIIRGNPVLWRELRQPMFLRWWHPWLVIAALAAMLILAYYQAGLSEPTPMFVAQIALTAILLFQACVLAAGSISAERESRSLETLLATPLTARAIVLAKWAAAVRRLYPIPAVSLVIIFVLGVLPGTFRPVLMLHYVLLVLAPAAALTASGLWLSVVTRKTAVASTLNVLLAFAFWAGVPFVVGMTLTIINAGQGFARSGETVMGTILVANPGAMLITALLGASENHRNGYQSFLEFGPETFLLACVASTLLFAMFTALFLTLASTALRSRTNRKA